MKKLILMSVMAFCFCVVAHGAGLDAITEGFGHGGGHFELRAHNAFCGYWMPLCMVSKSSGDTKIGTVESFVPMFMCRLF